MVITVLSGIILILFLWLFIDFKLGRRNHIKQAIKKEYPDRLSDCSLLTDGHNFYNGLFKDMREATHHIHILFYIVKNDQISHEFLNILKEKAREGVKVRLLLDLIGSREVSRKTQSALRDSGVEFGFSRRPHFPYIFYSINTRNHRKIAVIDGKTGYIGGFNIGKEYLGQDPKYGDWRDYHLKLKNDGVQDLQEQFLKDWRDAIRKEFPRSPDYYPELPKGNVHIKLIPTDGAFMQEIFVRILNQAKNRIMIGSPYFIPDKKMVSLLKEKITAGIEVSILVPKKEDKALVKAASMPHLKELLKAGAKIYQYNQGFFHAKIVLIDDHICDIGTANFDNRSFYLNSEMNCLFYDQEFIKQAEEKLLEDFERSEVLTLESIKNRSLLLKGKEKVAVAFSFLL